MNTEKEPANEQSHGQKNAEEQNTSPKNYSELIHKEQLDKSPITLIRTINEKEQIRWFAALGMKRLTDYHDTRESLIEETGSWTFAVTLVTAVASDIYDTKQNNLRLDISQ